MAAIPDSQALVTPPSGKAVVVFLRPSSFGGAVQSSVFDISAEPITIVGIVSAEKKVAYVTGPGVKRFMVIGETAEFMDATLLAGKTYYVRVTPHLGMWKTRFSLDPVAHAESGQQLEEDLASTSWMANTPASLEWAQSNMTSIRAKKAEYLQSWLSDSEKPTLRANDGR